MSLILTTAIEKGGTGKTTTVVNLAALMAAEGKRVLVVDMDQQANTTYMLTQHKKAENFYKGHGLVNMFMNFDLGGMDLAPYPPTWRAFISSPALLRRLVPFTSWICWRTSIR